MTHHNLIRSAALGLCLGGVSPAYAGGLITDLPAATAQAPMIMAARDGEPGYRWNGREQIERQDRSEPRRDSEVRRRQQSEAGRDDREGGFGYGYERRQERMERPMEGRRGR